ncbi:hypothetical protein HDV02_001145 [Globomyces sp. JEL0801]|nr:hypothetical protein HDV02_001145 [Globomyces sp. JEL0801]
MVRIKDFNGIVPKGCELKSCNTYFHNKKHVYSLVIQGSFTDTYTVDDILVASEFERPINVPHFIVKFWNMVAPHSMTDLAGIKPFVRSFALSASSIINISASKLLEFSKHIQEDINAILPSNLQIKKNRHSFWETEEGHLVAARRKLFVLEENRKQAVIKPDSTICLETFNSFFDPNTFKVRIPLGLDIDLHHILDYQPLRFHLKTKDDSKHFALVELSLVPEVSTD